MRIVVYLVTFLEQGFASEELAMSIIDAQRMASMEIRDGAEEARIERLVLTGRPREIVCSVFSRDLSPLSRETVGIYERGQLRTRRRDGHKYYQPIRRSP